ncbi:hypothetical protein H2201_008725, partial [Coniosporium apollinis]
MESELENMVDFLPGHQDNGNNKRSTDGTSSPDPQRKRQRFGFQEITTHVTPLTGNDSIILLADDGRRNAIGENRTASMFQSQSEVAIRPEDRIGWDERHETDQIEGLNSAPRASVANADGNEPVARKDATTEEHGHAVYADTTKSTEEVALDDDRSASVSNTSFNQSDPTRQTSGEDEQNLDLTCSSVEDDYHTNPSVTEMAGFGSGYHGSPESVIVDEPTTLTISNEYSATYIGLSGEDFRQADIGEMDHEYVTDAADAARNGPEHSHSPAADTDPTQRGTAEDLNAELPPATSPSSTGDDSRTGSAVADARYDLRSGTIHCTLPITLKAKQPARATVTRNTPEDDNESGSEIGVGEIERATEYFTVKDNTSPFYTVELRASYSTPWHSPKPWGSLEGLASIKWNGITYKIGDIIHVRQDDERDPVEIAEIAEIKDLGDTRSVL